MSLTDRTYECECGRTVPIGRACNCKISRVLSSERGNPDAVGMNLFSGDRGGDEPEVAVDDEDNG